jgi:SAM-dependent methyltransferase
MSRPSFASLFEAHQGRPCHKWRHYFAAYDREFAPYRAAPVKMLEIGVARGGSIALWRQFLGPEAQIVGVDINPRCKGFEAPGIAVEIGSQADTAFLAELVSKHGPFDIILDDGSHRMADQITSLEALWPALRPGGTYAVEDIHTSYFTRFGGGYRRPESFVEHAKAKIDVQHMWWSHRMARAEVEPWAPWLSRITFYPGMVFFQREPMAPPRPLMSGAEGLREDPPRRLAYGRESDLTG